MNNLESTSYPTYCISQEAHLELEAIWNTWRRFSSNPNIQIQRCECGADSVRGLHSTWCPKYEEVIK